MSSLQIIVRENDMLDALKNLQHHVHFFSSALSDQEQLKNKVIEHIKKNFIISLSDDIKQKKFQSSDHHHKIKQPGLNINLSPTKTSPHQNRSHLSQPAGPDEIKEDAQEKFQILFSKGNHSPNILFRDYLDCIIHRKDILHPTDKPLLPNFLLGVEIDLLHIDLKIEKNGSKLECEFGKITAMDLLGVNKEIKNILEIDAGTTFIYANSCTKKFVNFSIFFGNVFIYIIKDSERGGIFINQSIIDVFLPKINTFIYKPFFERISKIKYFLQINLKLASLIDFLNFRPENENENKSKLGNPIYFDLILRKKVFC